MTHLVSIDRVVSSLGCLGSKLLNPSNGSMPSSGYLDSLVLLSSALKEEVALVLVGMCPPG